MEIRRAREADAGAVAALAAALLDELSEGEPGGETQRVLVERSADLLRTGAVEALIAEDGGEAVGVVVLNACASVYAGRFGEITELYVRPAYRSAGAGKMLLDAAVAHGRSRGWSRLEVGTPELPRWARTAAFYRREGFTEIGARMKRVLSADADGC